jgi:small conductance mechanosensitive channel
MGKILGPLDIDRIAASLWDRMPSVAGAVLILAAFWALYRTSRAWLRKILTRARFQETLIQLLVDSIYRFLLLALGAVMAAAQLGLNVGAAVAGLGIAGVAVGFAAQDSLANMISGFLIFWDKPFAVGDWVTVSGQYGRVSEITLRTTRIRTNNNTYVVIPNKNIIDEVLVNHSKHGETRIDVPVGIAYKESIPEARNAILRAVRSVPGVIESPAPEVVVAGLGSSSVDLVVRVWIDDAADERPAFYGVMEASKLALDAAGIEIPYHHVQLFVEDVRGRVWDGAAKRLSGRTAAGGGTA